MSKTSSWIKSDDVPIWWPPKLDDIYKKEDHTLIHIAQAIAGWCAFVFCYGIVVFIWVVLIKYVILTGE